MKKLLLQATTIGIGALVLALGGCREAKHPTFTKEERHTTDSIVKSVRNLEALDVLQRQFQTKGDKLGEMAVYREKGKILRNDNQFSEALKTHSEGLHLAEQLNDTLEIVQALNNIGTDYRRMGILDVAQMHHYRAWMIAHEYSDTTFTAKKNRVVSLNGLANVYLSIGNLNRADSALRLALAGETELGSLTGQAINNANLGAIYEKRGLTDSAWVYYKRSMDLNVRDNNTLGIALCHTYFGDMHSKAHKYDEALAEYEQAYELMKDSRDNWHMLNSLIALAGIWNEKDDFAKTKQYLDEAQAVAKKIDSKEHLADIYRLYSDMYKKSGDYRNALEYKEQSTELKAGLVDMDKVNRIQNTSLALERERQGRQMAEANDRLTREQSARRLAYIVFIVVVVLLGGLIASLVHTRRLRSKSHKALKELNKVRESFFTNITHEFRTPLTVILALSHDLQHAEAGGDAKEIGSTIERQGQRILTLINQLLDISKIRSNIGVPDWRTGNMGAYIGMIVETYNDYAKHQGVRLQYISNDKESESDFVPDYITKIVTNLLSNALKYTPQYGTVSVQLQIEGKLVKLDVSDNGKGIAAENLPHVFEEFYQSDSAAGTGSGVGLALVQQIVKTLEGTISIDSTLGKGTTVHVVLPLRKNSTPYPSPSVEVETAIAGYVADQSAEAPQLNVGITPDNKDNEPAAEVEGDMPTRVLVVEDNADIAAYIGNQLKNKYVVSYASDGKMGCEMAHEWMPDIIITDIMMPVMDGLTLCRNIRNDEVTNHIPIIVITAKVTEEERIEGLKAGADAYLTKPFNSDELKTRVEKLLEQRATLSRKYAKELDNIIEPAAGQDVQPVDGKTTISEIDRRFLTKVTDCVYMMLNNQKSVDVNAVAERVFMTYGQFNRKLTMLTGYTPAQYIQRIKIKKAQRLLLSRPELCFNDISEQCGFSDYSNFVRAFKNICGITPTQYVRQQSPDR